MLFVFFGLTQLGVNQMGLGDFQKLNKLRSQVFDHPVLQLNKDDFKEDDPSLYYFANGLIDFGTDDLSIKKLQDWKQLLDQKRVAYLSFESIVKSLYFFIIHERFFLLLIGSFFCFGIVKDWNLTLRLTSFLSIVVLFSSPFFLLKVQIYVLVFIVFFCLFFIFSKNDTRNQSFNLIYFLFLISIVVYHVFSLISYSNIDSSTTKMEKLILKANANNSGEVFLIASNVDYMKIIPGRPANFKLLGWITLLEKCQKKDLNSNRIYLIEKEIYESNSMYFEKSASNYSGSMRIILFEK
ncbi:hypothetical protein [Algoriphagus marinus]|uniref:hypothetical protein n=1 Tax=Algoriphagus marinus TaxID=1925762 RepID=UPI001115247A|nr:hypothetical protein [Algoriphagus marinus]